MRYTLPCQLFYFADLFLNMKKFLIFIFALVLFVSSKMLTSAFSGTLGTDAHCDNPWFYKFNFSGEDVSIEHCGRTDKGVLDYTFTSPNAGEVLVYYKSDINTTLKLKINGKSYSKTVKGREVWHTGVMIAAGDKVSFLADMKDMPYSGWISPKNNLCNGFSGAGAADVSDLYSAITSDGNKLISAQCWGDGYAHEKFLKESYSKPNVNITCNGSAKDCHDVEIEDMDFNAGAFFLAVNDRIEHKSSCDDLNIISGNNTKVPAKMTFEIKASDNLGLIKQYRYIFGDGGKIETEHAKIDHTYESSGKFSVIAEVKDSKDNWVKSEKCEVLATVTAVSIESHRSSCSYLYIVDGQNHQAPSLVKFKVAGYDNKGDLKSYKIDFGDGNAVEAGSNQFEHNYPQPGTYKVKAQVKDSTDKWIEDSDCEQTVYVSTAPITKQPSTGTPTWMSVIGLGGGALAFAYPFIQGTKNMNKSFSKNSSKKRKK